VHSGTRRLVYLSAWERVKSWHAATKSLLFAAHTVQINECGKEDVSEYWRDNQHYQWDVELEGGCQKRGWYHLAPGEKPSVDFHYRLDVREKTYSKDFPYLLFSNTYQENLDLTGLWGYKACFVHVLWVWSCQCMKIQDRFMICTPTTEMWMDFFFKHRCNITG